MQNNDQNNNNVLAAVAWAGQIFTGGLVTVIIYVCCADRPFVRYHAAMAISAWIVWAICGAISFVLTFVLIGVLTAAATSIWALVVCIVGIVMALSGRTYSPPIIGQVCRKIFKV